MVLGCVVNVYYSTFHLVSQWGTHTMEAVVEIKNLKEKGESGDSRIRRTLLPVMSSINPDLEFTAEICEDFDDKTSRCGLKINHTFYEKPMMKQFLLHISLPAIAVL